MWKKKRKLKNIFKQFQRDKRKEYLLSDICLLLPPEMTWHKVNYPKIDCSGYLREGKVGHEPRLEPCLKMLVIGPLCAMWV